MGTDAPKKLSKAMQRFKKEADLQEEAPTTDRHDKLRHGEPCCIVVQAMVLWRKN